MVEWLLGLPKADAAEAVLLSEDLLEAPYLLLTEVAQATRRYEARGEISEDRATTAMQALGELDLHLHPHDILASEVWRLRQNLTAYDATYVALASVLEVPLVTFDQRLAKAPGNDVTIIVPS